MEKKKIIVVDKEPYFVNSLRKSLKETGVLTLVRVVRLSNVAALNRCGWFDMVLLPMTAQNLIEKLIKAKKPFAFYTSPISRTFCYCDLFKDVPELLFWDRDERIIAQHIKDTLGIYK